MRIYEAPAVVLPVERKGGSRRLLITTHLKIIFIITLYNHDHLGGDFHFCHLLGQNDEIHLNCELKARCEEVMPVPTSSFY